MFDVILYDDFSDEYGTYLQAPNTVSQLTDAKISKSINNSDTFSFTMYPNNESFNKLKPLITRLRVVNPINSETVFLGRILFTTLNDESGEIKKEVTAISDLDYLNDSLIDYTKIENKEAVEVFKEILNQHNSRVEKEKQFKFGKTDFSTSSKDRYLEPGKKALEEIQHLIENDGGEIQLRYEKDGMYLDWLKEITGYGDQILDIDKNLISAVEKVDPTKVFSILQPFGANLEQNNNNENNQENGKPTEKVDIKSVNNGKSYIESPELIKIFGRVMGTKTWGILKEPNEVLSAGEGYLEKQVIAHKTITVDAVDLASLKLGFDFFRVGYRYKVRNPRMALDEELRVVGIDLNINDWSDFSLTIGEKPLTLSEFNKL